jgi:hypothetical protein
VPLGCFVLAFGWLTGWDTVLFRLVLIGLAVMFVVNRAICLLAKSKIGLIVLVLGSIALIAVFAQHNPREAGTAAGFGILATIASTRRSTDAPKPSPQP